MSEQKTLKLFISYSHDDEKYFEIFNNGFSKVAGNTRNYIWDIWTDKKIHIGSFWDDEIQNNIKECNVAILLVSVGFMASKYIREKEYEEFIKRYTEKGIVIIPIIFAPCDFEAWDDLAKLQFFKPKGSDFGQHEITDFTYADLIKFNEKNGVLIPNPNIQRYHLQLIKEIEKTYLQYEQSINKYIEKTQKVLNDSHNNLFDYPKPTVLFTGRNAEKKQFKETLELFRIFAIDGLGGTGKTQFAAKCIDEFIQNKDRIIWLNGSAQSNFDVFVENSGYGNVLKGKEKTDLILFSGLKDHIEKDERIIFWDNFNDYEDTAFSKFLSFANYYLQKSRIILITKTEPNIDGITTMPIIRLDGLKDDAIEYGKKIKSSNSQYESISESDIEKICSAVEGHPLAIEFSLSLISRGKSVKDIILHLPELSGIKKVEEFSKRLFLDIFNHSNTTDEERKCFLKCSVFREKFSEVEIKYINDGADVYHLIDGLIDKLLLTSRNGLYEIHPLVRSFSYEKLSDKKTIHNKAAAYFTNLRDEFLSPSLEEKIYYHLSAAKEWELIADYIERDGKMFLQQGQLNFLSDLLLKLNNVNIWRDVFFILNGDIAQIKSELNLALDFFKKTSNSEDNKIKAEGIIKSGEITFRKGNLKEALAIFEEAYDFSNSKNLIKEKARALNDIGLVLFEFSKPEQANLKYNEALELRIKINDQEGIATTYNNIGNIYQSQRKYSKALEFYQKSLEIGVEIGDKINLPLYYVNIAITLRNQNKGKEALISNKQALILYNEIGNQSGIATTYCSIGSIHIKEKHFDMALEKLKQAQDLCTEINDLNNISDVYHNMGVLYFEKKEYSMALLNFYKSLNYYRKNGNKKNENLLYNWIKNIYTAIGNAEFTIVSEQIISKEEINIDYRDFLQETYSRTNRKINRNEIVQVQYKVTGKIVEAKFKKLEKDINNDDCFLI